VESDAEAITELVTFETGVYASTKASVTTNTLAHQHLLKISGAACEANLTSVIDHRRCLGEPHYLHHLSRPQRCWFRIIKASNHNSFSLPSGNETDNNASVPQQQHPQHQSHQHSRISSRNNSNSTPTAADGRGWHLWLVEKAAAGAAALKKVRSL